MIEIKNKRGQLTLFIILALAIVAVLAIIFYPRLNPFTAPQAPGELVPTDCIKNAIGGALNKTMLSGGKMNPELYFIYNNYKLDYLCYTQDWYKTCEMQVPFLKQEVESEIQNATKSQISNCIATMEQQLKNQGYTVTTKGPRTGVIQITPNSIETYLNISMTITKGEAIQTISSGRFETTYKSQAYDMIMVAGSIQNYEARFGDSIPETYMAIYPDLKVQKLKQSDGTKVYILTNRNTGEVLQFATRSLAWPPGYIGK